MTIKLVSIDIDNTLLTDKYEITKENKEAISKAIDKGVKIVITTGRPLLGAIKIIKEVGIDNENQFIITYNGASIQNNVGKVILENSLKLSEMEMIQNYSYLQNGYLQFESLKEAFTLNKNINTFANFENNMTNLPLVIGDKLEPKYQFLKGIMTDEKELVDSWEANLTDQLKSDLNIIRSTPNILEFVNKETSKGLALKQLAKYLDIDISETMAIGDQQNDYSMIKEAGVGVAMGNAIDSIKKIASYETDDNNNSGVAKAINKFVL